MKKAREYFNGAVEVTPTMAYECIVALKNAGIKYVVAPYEADAQIVSNMKPLKNFMTLYWY